MCAFVDLKMCLKGKSFRLRVVSFFIILITVVKFDFERIQGVGRASFIFFFFPLLLTARQTDM